MKCLQSGVADASGLDKCRTSVCSALKALGIPVLWADNGALGPSMRMAPCFLFSAAADSPRYCCVHPFLGPKLPLIPRKCLPSCIHLSAEFRGSNSDFGVYFLKKPQTKKPQ